MTTDRELLEKLADEIAQKRALIGTVDGYDYRSGEEAGLREAEIMLRDALAQPVAEVGDVKVLPKDPTPEMVEAGRAALGQGKDGVQTHARTMWCYEAMYKAAPDLRAAQPDETRDARQTRVADWCKAAFGSEQQSSIPQRGIRLLEEAIECAQAAGCDRDMAHKLVDYIFDRPPGALFQELGGVGVTVLALAAAASLSADEAEKTEIARVLAKSLAHFAARNQAKNDAGFLAAEAEKTDKPKLALQAGRWYRRRDGTKVGPLQADAPFPHKFRVGIGIAGWDFYDENGRHYNHRVLDLVAEIERGTQG